MDSLTALHAEMRACRLCLQAGYEITPPAVFSGRSSARVMLIGQAPGVTEVEAQRPFNAGSGARLFQWLGEAGWDEDEFRARCYMTAVTKCYPGKDSKSGKGDRVPTRAEQALCRPFLEREIALVNPQLIIPVGGLAIKLFYPNSAKLRDVIGRAAYFPPEALADPVNFNLKDAHPLRWKSNQLSVNSNQSPPNLILNTEHRILNTGRFLVPLPHPSGASLWPNKPANRALIDQAIAILRHLRQTLDL